VLSAEGGQGDHGGGVELVDVPAGAGDVTSRDDQGRALAEVPRAEQSHGSAGACGLLFVVEVGEQVRALV
jgi:hypothetical protein